MSIKSIVKNSRLLRIASPRRWKYFFPGLFGIHTGDIPAEFIAQGLFIPHACNITISPESMGCDCRIAQNTTIGASFTQLAYNETTLGNRPRLGHLVALMPGSVISGRIRIGHCVICAANSVITRDVPSFSIAYGVNEIRPVEKRHISAFSHMLYQCASNLKTGGKYVLDGKSYTDGPYLALREKALASIDNPDAVRAILEEGIPHTDYARALLTIGGEGAYSTASDHDRPAAL